MVSRRPRQPRTPERVVQAHIVTMLRSIGASVYVLGTKRRKGDYQGTMQTPGIPDLYVILPAPRYRADGAPSAVWIEVKAVGGVPSDAQKVFAHACAEIGVPHVMGGLDDVIAFLVAGGWVRVESLPHYRHPEAAQGQ